MARVAVERFGRGKVIEERIGGNSRKRILPSFPDLSDVDSGP